MVRDIAKKAMTTDAQKACYVIDHLIEALGSDASSSLRRAMILVDIDQHPGTTQSEIIKRLQLHKSALNREIGWMFNYGCILVQECTDDARAKRLETCGYSKNALVQALDYTGGIHENLRYLLEQYIIALRSEKPSLRDAKIIATLHEREEADKKDLVKTLPDGSTSTNNRAINKLIEDGVIEE